MMKLLAGSKRGKCISTYLLMLEKLSVSDKKLCPQDGLLEVIPPVR